MIAYVLLLHNFDFEGTTTTLIGVYDSEEAAFCAGEDLKQKMQANSIWNRWREDRHDLEIVPTHINSYTHDGLDLFEDRQ